MAIPVLNKHHGNLPEGAVYIGRPTRYGNPYSHMWEALAEFSVPTRDDAVEYFRKWFEQIVEADPGAFDDLLTATALVCWCAPASCHGDIISEYLERRQRWLDITTEEA